MIRLGSEELAARYYGRKVVSAVYLGTRLIWQAISSCFGSGVWVNKYPWKNGDAWKNN